VTAAVDVAALSALLAKASPTPWTLGTYYTSDEKPDEGRAVVDPSGNAVCAMAPFHLADMSDEDNARLIVAAVNSLPALLALVGSREALATAVLKTFGRFCKRDMDNEAWRNERDAVLAQARAALASTPDTKEV